jgi:hypothetical protein
MARHTENQVIGPQQQHRQQDTLLNALLTGALYNASSAPDNLTPPPVPQGLAVGEGEDRGDETRATLIYFIDSVLDLMKDDAFPPCDELEL